MGANSPNSISSFFHMSLRLKSSVRPGFVDTSIISPTRCSVLQVLKKISSYIQEQNEKIYAPRGLLLTDPVERGMRVVSFSMSALHTNWFTVEWRSGPDIPACCVCSRILSGWKRISMTLLRQISTIYQCISLKKSTSSEHTNLSAVCQSFSVV